MNSKIHAHDDKNTLAQLLKVCKSPCEFCEQIPGDTRKLFHCKGPNCEEYIAHIWHNHEKAAHVYDDAELIA